MNPRAPVKVAVYRLKLSRESHRAPVNRIDADGAVVTPAMQGSCLYSASSENRGLVSHRSQRIGWATIGITNAGYDRACIGDVVTDGNAAGLVHRSAAHPAKIV